MDILVCTVARAMNHFFHQDDCTLVSSMRTIQLVEPYEERMNIGSQCVVDQ